MLVITCLRKLGSDVTSLADKTPKVGLKQAYRLCQMAKRERLECIAEGLPIIAASSRELRAASNILAEHRRSADVLAGNADEEAAKILVLLDLVRCPEKAAARRAGSLIRWFYDHNARLLYAESVSWRPVDVAELRRCVDSKRESHLLEGNAGEYILPNWGLYEREAKLYVDIEANCDGGVTWNTPGESRASYFGGHSSLAKLVEALEKLGLFTAAGLRAVSEIWDTTYFSDDRTAQDGDRLMQKLLERVVTEKLPHPDVEQRHVRALWAHWQLPMYDLDLLLKPVSLEDLEAEQERLRWAEVGNAW